jgi:glycogen operon protein
VASIFVASFPDPRGSKEYRRIGRFRDDARDFFRGEAGSLRRFADRLVGSHEVYGHKGREAEQSVNFVTCYDGFTLNDLVSYNEKHNEANGEDNRDGKGHYRSWNCGIEGPTDDPAVEAMWNWQVKNFLAVTMMSLGVPMIVMGDEVRRTQGGNNNFYCHDNEANWFDWSLVERHADVQRLVKLLLARRLLRDVTHEEQRTSLTALIERANKAWHGVKLNRPDWGDGSHAIAFSAELKREGLLFHLILNGYWEPLEFDLPPVPEGRPWRRWIDTSLPSPQDIVEWQTAPRTGSGPVQSSCFSRGPGERPSNPHPVASVRVPEPWFVLGTVTVARGGSSRPQRAS